MVYLMPQAPARNIDDRSPRETILEDCEAALTAIDSLMRRIIAHNVTPDQMKVRIQQLHTLKGATSMAGLDGLAEDLHQLEGDLIDVLRRPLSFADATLVSRSLDAAFKHLATSARRARPAPEKPLRHFGEALWWSTQMVQVTARGMGKRVFLMVKGGECLIPTPHFIAMQSSLQHLTRNAVVHGIELPEQRREAGKPGLGLIRIMGRRMPNSLVVNITDNGSGLPEGDIDSLFRMGVSTAESVTPAAGRGVGLPAVLDNIQSLGGTVSVHTVRGKGTAFTLRIPLSD